MGISRHCVVGLLGKSLAEFTYWIEKTARYLSFRLVWQFRAGKVLVDQQIAL